LTLQGASFAARVAASILTAAGIGEMIAASPSEYEGRAAELARSPEALAAIRAKLQANRQASPLFDTVLFTRHLESAYATMYERASRGLPPAAFAVESISNE
jgi:predicted O-linked N-acetylglucosamine transferase (SPINDLY family)